MIDKLKKYLRQLSFREYAYFAVQIFILIFVFRFFQSRFNPILKASEYTHPGMDDYWMSYGVHEVWMKTHSLWKCIQRSFINAVALYNNWDGNILSMFLTGLTPVTFNENRYHLVFIISFIDLALGAGMVSYSLLHRRWKISVINCISICLLFLIFYIDFAPSATEGIYWWPGIANYNLFFGMLLFAQGMFILYWDRHNIVWLIISGIVFFLVGLGNPITGLVNVCLLAYELIYEIYRKKSFKTLYYIPFAMALAGLIIVISAPGNSSRIVGERLSIFTVILDSFKYGSIMTKASIRPAFSIYMIMVALISFGNFVYSMKDINEKKDIKADIKKIIETVIYIIMMVCLYYAAYAPLIYTKCDWYGRVLNTTAFVYYMVMTSINIYVCRTVAYFFVKFISNIKSDKINIIKTCEVIVSVIATITIVISINTLNGSDYYKSGSLARDAEHALTFQKAQEYDAERDRIFMQLLDPNVEEVHIGEIPVISFYPYIDEVIDHMEIYYGKKIIVD